MKLTKSIEFEPAWDKRNVVPSKNYGIHGVQIRFLLKGSKGVIQFLIFTNWQLPAVQKEQGYCYYDGSGLAAERVLDILLENGSDGVWQYLEDYYQSIFIEKKKGMKDGKCRTMV